MRGLKSLFLPLKDFVGRGRCDRSSPAVTWAETESLVPVFFPSQVEVDGSCGSWSPGGVGEN